jgi:hypothetical protein
VTITELERIGELSQVFWFRAERKPLSPENRKALESSARTREKALQGDIRHKEKMAEPQKQEEEKARKTDTRDQDSSTTPTSPSTKSTIAETGIQKT